MIDRYLAACPAMAVALAMAGPAAAQPTYSFDLPGQPLAASLRAVGSRTRTNIVFRSEIVRARSAPPLRGTYTLPAAIEHLLQGSGLAMSLTSGRTVLIQPGPQS